MKRFAPFLLMICLVFLCSDSSENTLVVNFTNTINPLIGDISFFEKYGTLPDKNVDEQLRIATHLSYVERKLREKDVSHLPQDLQCKRENLLNHLQDYWSVGTFPKNYDYSDERKPCFIDRDDNICAVGYLVEQTVGRKVAEKINADFQYAIVEEMHSPILADWAVNSGLDLEEFAMIQPTYGPTPSVNYVKPSYGVSSALLSGVNLSLSTLNTMQINNPSNTKTVPKLGLLLGAGQLTLGMINYFNAENTEGRYSYINEGKKNLSLVNIALGTSTILLSTYNLTKNRKKKHKQAVNFNLYSESMENNEVAVGLSLTKGF